METKDKIIAFANFFHKEKERMRRTGKLLKRPDELFDEFFNVELKSRLKDTTQSANFMQSRDLTDEEWLKLPKEEILQLYKNCYSMLQNYLKQPDPLLKESGGKLNKTAEEILGKIAKKYEFNSWREMIWIANRNRREEYIIEAINHAVKYTSQFQEQPITVTEDIISAKLDSMNFETSKEREDAYDIAEWVLSLKAQKPQLSDDWQKKLRQWLREQGYNPEWEEIEELIAWLAEAQKGE